MGNRYMGGKSKPIDAMGTVPVKLKIGSRIRFHTLLETGERKPLSRRVKAIRSSGKMTVRNIRSTIVIVPSFKERFTDQLFISGVVSN